MVTISNDYLSFDSPVTWKYLRIILKYCLALNNLYNIVLYGKLVCMYLILLSVNLYKVIVLCYNYLRMGTTTYRFGQMKIYLMMQMIKICMCKFFCDDSVWSMLVLRPQIISCLCSRSPNA